MQKDRCLEGPTFDTFGQKPLCSAPSPWNLGTLWILGPHGRFVLPGDTEPLLTHCGSGNSPKGPWQAGREEERGCLPFCLCRLLP